MKTLGAISAGLWLAVAGGASAQQFDLTCRGVLQEAIDGPETAYSYGFRIDLDGRRWCWDHCERTFDIQDVGPERITLVAEDTDQPRRRYFSTNEISRVDGSHELVSIATRPVPSYRHVEGQCERAPFSGFPATKF